MTPITVLVVDDQELIRSAVTALIAAADDLVVVGEAADGEAAVREAGRLRPDIVLMDIRMPRLDGVAATARITADPTLAATRVVVLTTFEEDDTVIEALRAGASGFVGKGAAPAEILTAIRVVDGGEALLSPRATRALIDRAARGTSRSSARPAPALDGLTEREREVLTMVGQGLSNDEIAAALFISASTAKTHVNRVMMKLAAHDRAQLVIAAYESGLVVPGVS